MVVGRKAIWKAAVGQTGGDNSDTNLSLRLSLTRIILLCQLLATAAALGWIPGNRAKLITMLSIWALGFRRIRSAELLAMAAVNLLFILMNSAALKRGIFAFNHPNLIGMPIYEYFMWGFYTLHTIRFVDGPAPNGKPMIASVAAAAFAVPFAIIADPVVLLAASATVFAGCLALFHEPRDLAYAGYMAAVGALIEYTGVRTGQWHYPGDHLGGVPLWFLPMWAGIGLFTRRLVLVLSRSPAHPRF
jgi:hypothetical protein